VHKLEEGLIGSMDWKEFQLDKELDASNIPWLYSVDYARCAEFQMALTRLLLPLTNLPSLMMMDRSFDARIQSTFGM